MEHSAKSIFLSEEAVAISILSYPPSMSSTSYLSLNYHLCSVSIMTTYPKAGEPADFRDQRTPTPLIPDLEDRVRQLVENQGSPSVSIPTRRNGLIRTQKACLFCGGWGEGQLVWFHRVHIHSVMDRLPYSHKSRTFCRLLVVFDLQSQLSSNV